MNWFAWAVGALVLVLGLLMTRATLKRRFQFVAVVTLLACGLPLLGGPMTEFVNPCAAALIAVIALIPIWTVIAFGSAITRGARRLARGAMRLVSVATAIVVFASVVDQTTTVMAQDITELLKPLLDADDPVQLPEDAIVIPYDPTDPAGRHQAEKVLVPYRQYVELWNQAHPDKQIDGAEQKYEFSLAGVDYAVVLDEGDDLVLQGTIDIQVFQDGDVEVPLALQQGVIAGAKLDGQPARLKAVQPASPPPRSPSKKQAAANQAAAPPPALLTVLVQGKGQHRLELSVRVRVTRQGGRRFAHATLPHAEATAVSMTVPGQGTQVRWTIAGKTQNQTTDADGQTIESVLGAGGVLDLSWRPVVSAGLIDQALTGNSDAVVDLREDGIRVLWNIAFEFGQTERGLFQVEVPGDFLVEKVEGSNVRGWDLEDRAGKSILNVELLKSVKQKESFTVHLSRRFALATGDRTPVEVPVVSLPDAALHRGTLRIRRSPILDLQTISAEGVTRTDTKPFTQAVQTQLSQAESPLGVQDFQSYEFKATPYSVRLAISEIAPRISAELRTLARIGESESEVESEVLVSTQSRPVYRVRIRIPSDLELETVAAAQLSDWSIVEEDEQRVLNVYFIAGQEGNFAISLQGRLNDHTANEQLPLPHLEVLDVNQQRGTIVIQVDPSLDASLRDLVQCSPVLLNQAASWLTAQQRPLARMAVQYEGTGYGGTISISPRTSRVTCDTITNVRLTYREIQETILLDFRIQRAGTRSIVFRLPSWLADAKITAPMIRQQTIEQVEGRDQVRVTLDLQDAMTGQYRVVIESDRAITPQQQEAPLPWIETGSTNLRYITLENAGRDEVVVGELTGFEPLNRQSRQWQQLANRLRGGDFTTAFVAIDSAAEDSRFTYGTKRREIVKTAGATIGLTRTTIVVDGSGAYRASQLLKVDNRTEPHLEIRLPASATLWTAHVADRPVKPSKSDDGNDRVLRIPLVKTAEGDLDYPVLLKYGGTLGQLEPLKAVEFPMIRAVNIDPELSQIKLMLPDSHRWLHFDGTAQRVDGEDDFMAGYLNYRTQQVQSLTQILRGKNDFSKMRASGNIKSLDKELKRMTRRAKRLVGNEQLRRNLEQSERAVKEASQQMAEMRQRVEQVEDNRQRLNKFYDQQQNSLARNSVTRLGKNFDLPSQPAQPSGQVRRRFDDRWFSNLGLGAQPADKESQSQKGQAADGYKRLQTDFGDRLDRPQPNADAPEAANAAQRVFQVQPSPKKPVTGPRAPRRGGTAGFTTQSQLSRAYEQKIEQQQQVEGRARGAYVQSRQPTAGADDSLIAGDQLAAGEAIVLGEPLAGLASLDLDIPERGSAYYFTTPGKGVTITARPVTNDVVRRAVDLGWLIGIAVALGIVFAVTRRLSQSRRGLIVGAIVLILVGLAMMVTGKLPLFGLVLILGGILLIVDPAGVAE
jgi:hypothetical protein